MNKVGYKIIIAFIITITVVSGVVLLGASKKSPNKEGASSNNISINASLGSEINETQPKNDNSSLTVRSGPLELVTSSNSNVTQFGGMSSNNDTIKIYAGFCGSSDGDLEWCKNITKKYQSK